MVSSNFGRRLPSHAGMPHILTLFFLLAFATNVGAFGAGTTTSDGSKWRHGDIENALLGLMLARTTTGLPFTTMDVKRVYFGNWLRDYSQLMDVATLKVVGPNVLRTLVALFALMSFGYGTGEFEVSDSRLSVYRPEEHIDNPKHYAKNVDAKKVDNRLRGVVDDKLELITDERTGMKQYIGSERQGITTTAGYLRKALGRCIKLGRQHAKTKNYKDLDDALRHLGAALHALEDFSAHSNYIELCLRELGERGIFPHVGTTTEVEVRGSQVFPLVTGSFGSVDFLSSVVGGDPNNTNASELQQLEEHIMNALEADKESGGEIKLLKEHFDSLPQGLLEKRSIANLDLLEEKSRAKQDEAKTRADDGEPADLDAEDLYDQIYPILEMQDRVVREIVYGMKEVPSHAATYEKIQESLNTVTFSLIAPYILPVLQQARVELAESANEIITTARELEDEVFSDPYCSDPVHSIIAKDNASNVLSEPAGRVAVEVVRFVVPLIMRTWDEQEMEVDPLLDYIIGVLHHPVTRDERNHRGQAAMFAVVRDWWTLKSDDEKDELREQLSMDGIKANNHRHGTDTGHGGLKPIAGAGIKPGDTTGGIFDAKPPDDKAPEGDAERAPDPAEGTSMAAAAAAVQDGAKPHRRKRDRDGKTPRDKTGSQSPNKREHREKRQHAERGLDVAPPPEDQAHSRDSRRKHRSDGKTSQNDLGERSRHHHHRHRDEADQPLPEEQPKENKSRISQMFSTGFNYLGFGAAAAAASEPTSPRMNGGADKPRPPRNDGSEERPRRHRHRHDPERDNVDSPSRHRSTRRRERSKSDEEALKDDAPVVEGEGEPPAVDAPDTAEGAPPAEAEAEGDSGLERKSSKRRSSKKRDGHRSRREGGEPAIPEEDGDYFQEHHQEHELRGSKSKASKILGADVEHNGDPSRRSKPKRRYTDRDISDRRRQNEEPARGGFFGRIVSKADKFLGREPADEGIRPLERRKTGDREHGDRSRRRHYPDEDDKKRRRHRSVTLPVQVDPTDFAEAGPAPEENVPGSFPDGDDDRPATPTEKKRHRRHKSSPNPLQFDVPSDASGSDEKSRKKEEPGTPELQDVGGLSTEEPKPRRRRREREYDETPTPSPRKDRRKRGVKEVNFEDAVDSGEKREKSRRNRSSRDDAEEVDGSRERRRRDRKRDSAVFGGYGRD